MLGGRLCKGGKGSALVQSPEVRQRLRVLGLICCFLV